MICIVNIQDRLSDKHIQRYTHSKPPWDIAIYIALERALTLDRTPHTVNDHTTVEGDPQRLTYFLVNGK